MNLQSAKELSDLRIPQQKKVEPKVKSALQVARRVFKLAAQGGFPYKYHTPNSWAKKWLSSKEFVLMEIDINAAASPNSPKNPARVAHYINCSVESLDPIVVDLNKRKVGKTHCGYIPEVVVHDGKHRKQAQIMNGRLTIMAWVGKRAVKKIKPSKVLKASANGNGNGHHPPTSFSKFDTIQSLYAATVPGQNIPSKMADTGVGGSRPVDVMHSKKKMKAGGPGSGRHPDDVQKEYRERVEKGDLKPGEKEQYQREYRTAMQRHGLQAAGKDCRACGARSSGSLESVPDPSDAKIPPDESDTSQAVDPSDRLQFNPKKANTYAPGTGPGYSDQFGSPNFQAPGAGVGPRVTNKGASNSEFRRDMKFAMKKNTKGKLVPKMWNKKKKKWMDAVAPPGREEQVLKLKEKYGEKSAIPFKIAWSQHNKKGDEAAEA